MSKHILVLTNGEEVILDTRLTIGKLRRLQAEGIIEKGFINQIFIMEAKPEESNMRDEIFSAPYIAYRNANTDCMSKEAFEELLDIDMDFCADIYKELISGKTVTKVFSENFNKAANKNKNKNKNKNQDNKKKYQE